MTAERAYITVDKANDTAVFSKAYGGNECLSMPAEKVKRETVRFYVFPTALIRDVSQVVTDVSNAVEASEVRYPQTVHDLGWSSKKAARIRAQLKAFDDIWNDPSMDIYDEGY